MHIWFSILALLGPVAQAQDTTVALEPSVDTAPVDNDAGTEGPEDHDSDGMTEEPTTEGNEGDEGDESDESDESEPTSTIRDERPLVPYETIDTETLEADQALGALQLARYCEEAHSVVIAEVIQVYQQNQDQQVSLMIEEQLRGRTRGVIDIEIGMPSPTDDPTRIYPLVANDYRVLVFTDRRGRLIEGNSLFLLQGGYAWRNKRHDTFLEPAANQDWVSHMDPAQDYLMFSMDEIHACLD